MAPSQRITSAAYAIRTEKAEDSMKLNGKDESYYRNLSNMNTGVLSPIHGGTGASSKLISVINYTGNGVDNRIIPHGLGTIPSFIFLWHSDPSQNGQTLIVWSSDMPNGYSMTESNMMVRNDQPTIKSVDATKVTLGTHACVNANGSKYSMLVIRGQ